MICRFCGKEIERSPLDDDHIKLVEFFDDYKFPNPSVPAWRSKEITGSSLACSTSITIMKWHEPLILVAEMLNDLREIEKDLR